MSPAQYTFLACQIFVKQWEIYRIGIVKIATRYCSGSDADKYYQYDHDEKQPEDEGLLPKCSDERRKWDVLY